MFPLLGSAIGGLFSFFGQQSANEQSAANVAAQNQMSAAQQDKQIQFQRDAMQEQERYNTAMSSSAYQRANSDMQAAGLNPAMMFGTAGSGASSPQVSLPSGSSGFQPQRPDFQSPMSTVGRSIGDMISSAVQAKTLDKMVEEISNLKVQRDKDIASTALTQASTDTEKERKEYVQAQAGTQKQETDIARSKTDIYRNAARTAGNLLDMDPSVRKLLDWGAFGGKQVGDTLAPVLSIFNSAKSVWPKRSTSETTRDGDSTFTERWGY